MDHKDVLEQLIEYKVPPDKFDELAQYMAFKKGQKSEYTQGLHFLAATAIAETSFQSTVRA